MISVHYVNTSGACGAKNGVKKSSWVLFNLYIETKIVRFKYMIRKDSLLIIAKCVQVSIRRLFFTSPLLHPLHTTLHQGSSSLTFNYYPLAEIWLTPEDLNPYLELTTSKIFSFHADPWSKTKQRFSFIMENPLRLKQLWAMYHLFRISKKRQMRNIYSMHVTGTQFTNT